MNKILPKDAHSQDMLDPDARFLLANERTLLAWVRTSIALVGGGAVLSHIGGAEDPKNYVGRFVILTGILTCSIGYVRFKKSDKAIRTGKLPEVGNGPFVQVIGIIVIAVVLALTELLIM